MSRNVQPHEWLFLSLGVAVTGALLCIGRLSPLLWKVVGPTALYAVLISLTDKTARWRLLGSYVMAWACYSGSAEVVDALHVPLRHQELWAIDAALFGKPPALATVGIAPPWLNEFLSFGYLSYHVYLHWLLLEALLGLPQWRTRLANPLFTAFGLGFVGYLLSPAATPEAAFPEVFNIPLTGSALTHWNIQINQAMASPYDAFPSLHILITLVLLGVDWEACRWRFWLMLAPSLLLSLSTIMLRLHYAVDLMVAGILFIPIYQLQIRRAYADS